MAKDYIKEKYQKPGNVYLGVMSRLDAPVTGVVLLARTSKAAARMTEQFRTHAVQKTYWALVAGTPIRPGSYTDWLIQDEGTAACTWSTATVRGPRRPGGLPRAFRATAGYRFWKSSWKRGESTRSACKWPIMGTRLSATASTAAR